MMPSDESPGSEWGALLRQRGTPAFADAFSERATLRTSTMNDELVGIEQISAYYAATTGMYDGLTFIAEARSGGKTFMEWEARFRGQAVGGTTVLTRDEAGRIVHVDLFVRPLESVLAFSHELATRLNPSS